MLKKELDCTTQRVWGVVIGFVVGGAIGFVVARADDGWNFITGFSTLTLAVVAFWSLARDAWRRSEERRKLQGIYRWLIMGETTHAYQKVWELGKLLDKYLNLKGNSNFTSDDKTEALRIADELCVPNLDKHINALVFFENRSAQSLAYLAASLPIIRANIYTVFDEEENDVNKGQLAIDTCCRIDNLVLDAPSVEWEIRPPKR